MSGKNLNKIILSAHPLVVPSGSLGMIELQKEFKKKPKYYLMEGTEKMLSRMKKSEKDPRYPFFDKYPAFKMLSFNQANKKDLEIIPILGKGKHSNLLSGAEEGDSFAKKELAKLLKKKGFPSEHIMNYLGLKPLDTVSKNIDAVNTLKKHYLREEALEKTTGHLGLGHSVVLDVLKKKLGKKIPHKAIGMKPPWLELSDKITLAYFFPEEHGMSKDEIEDIAVSHLFLGKKFKKTYSNARKKDEQLQQMHKNMLGLIKNKLTLEHKIRELDILTEKKDRSSAYFSRRDALREKRKKNFQRIKKQKTEIKKRLKTIKR